MSVYQQINSGPGRRRRASIVVSMLAAVACLATACVASAWPASAGAATHHPRDRFGTALSSHARISPAACARNRAAGTINYVSGFGYSATAGQIDVFLAKALGYFKDLCLNVKIDASGADGEQLLAADRAQFTEIGSASDAILDATHNSQIVAIATYATHAPFAIFTRQSIHSLKQLQGGTLGYFVNMTPVALAMLHRAGVNVAKVKLIKMTDFNPDVVPEGQIDGIVGYESEQVQTLIAQHEPFHQFLPASYGITGTYNVMQTNRTFLSRHRAVAADFMRASLRALRVCLIHTGRCVTRLAAIAKAAGQGAVWPRTLLARTWKVEGAWVRGTRQANVGVQSEAIWRQADKLVHRYGKLEVDTAKIPPLRAMMDTKLVSDLYRGHALIWPGD